MRVDNKFFYEFISHSYNIRQAYYTLWIIIHIKITFPCNHPTQCKIPLVHQFVDVILEEMVILCMKLCPSFLHDFKIWLELIVSKMIFQCSEQIRTVWQMILVAFLAVENLWHSCDEFQIHSTSDWLPWTLWLSCCTRWQLPNEFLLEKALRHAENITDWTSITYCSCNCSTILKQLLWLSPGSYYDISTFMWTLPSWFMLPHTLFSSKWRCV
jgi:hypothetical protein